MGRFGWLSPKSYAGIRGDIGKVIVLASFVMTMSFIGIFKYTYDSYREAHINQTKYLLETIVRAASENLANELFSGQAASMYSALLEIEKSKNIFSVLVFKPDGALWVNAGDLLRQRMSKFEMGKLRNGSSFQIKSSNGEEAVVYAASISFAGEVFGYIEICYSLKEFNTYMMNMVVVFISVLLVLFLAVFIMLNAVLSRVVVQPVLRLRNAMVDFDQENWGQQFEVERDNEIGDMYQAFNAMSVKLDQNYSQLEQASHDLIEEMNRRKKAQDEMKCLEEDLDIRQREKIAGELHDGIGQSLQAANLGLKMINARVKDGVGIVSEDVSKVLDEIAAAIMQLRHITTELRPVLLDRLSLDKAIASHCLKLARYSGLTISTDISSGPLVLERHHKEHAFLIFQEALNNAIKHSRSNVIEVTLAKDQDDYVSMNVKDQGIGFCLDNQSEGIGLTLMKERACVLGGEFNILSDAEGTSINLRVRVRVDGSSHTC
ncbi:MAG: HAMP domain-containing protein [Magnetovibrio sp.]|nr:HAMP domain-containing protein [Magnetovibrio sp.]